MLRTIVTVVLLVALGAGCWMLYKRVNGDNTLGSGNVYQSGTERDQMETGTTYIGDKPIEAHPTPSRSDDPGTINTEPESQYLNGATGQTGNTQAQTNPSQPYSPQPASRPQPYSPQQPYATQQPYGQQPYPGPRTLPTNDTFAPNPPNGFAYSGAGDYEVYRQGDLTFRLDTKTGASCVLYATMEEWSKPIVYSHGCGSHARRVRYAR